MKNLKIIFATITALLLLNSYTFAQRKPISPDYSIEQGVVIVDAFYGYPYYNGIILKTLYQNVGNFRTTNHLGAKIEYMITDEIGLGLEITYAKASINYRDSLLQKYAEISKLRVLAKINYHFETDISAVDPYLTAGFGVRKNTSYQNGIDLSRDLFPVAIRVGAGMRYFFTDGVGANVEVGIGGPLMQGGVSFRF